MIGEASTLELTGEGSLTGSRWKLTGSGVSRLMVFQGTEPGNGTTLASFAAAVCAARATGLRVGYLSLGAKRMKLRRYLGISGLNYAIQPARSGWKTRTGPLQALINYGPVASVPNLSVLSGNGSEHPATIGAEAAERMLSAARSAFDICVVDLNSDLAVSAVYTALMEADACIAVAAPWSISELTGRFRSRRGASCAARLNSCFEVLVNQTDTEEHGRKQAADWLEFTRTTGLRIVGNIPWHREVADRLNKGRIMELLERNHPVGEAVRKLLRTYLKRWNEEALHRSGRIRIYNRRRSAANL